MAVSIKDTEDRTGAVAEHHLFHWRQQAKTLFYGFLFPEIYLYGPTTVVRNYTSNYTSKKIDR